MLVGGRPLLGAKISLSGCEEVLFRGSAGSRCYDKSWLLFVIIERVELSEKDVNAMDFSKEHLLASGFTTKELQMLQNNIDNFGGTFEQVVKDLSKRFNVLISIISLFCFFFVVSLFFSSHDKILSYGVGLVIVSVILVFIQPPVISFKCWRHYRGG